jgi:hypothetical protein
MSRGVSLKLTLSRSRWINKFAFNVLLMEERPLTKVLNHARVKIFFANYRSKIRLGLKSGDFMLMCVAILLVLKNIIFNHNINKVQPLKVNL